jgi:RNA polymerase sigma-70 factor (ECF subfamily)
MDAPGMREIYEQHLHAVYYFTYGRVGNREEAEDLTSQVFMKALRGIDSSRDAPVIRSWLLQIARTTLADHWRAFYRMPVRSLEDLLASGREDPAAAPEPGPSEWAAERVRQIFARLPERYREVLTYRFLLNYSIKETAEMMHLTTANAKILQFRALKKAGAVELEAALC